jgi:hypothetical protein
MIYKAKVGDSVQIWYPCALRGIRKAPHGKVGALVSIRRGQAVVVVDGVRYPVSIRNLLDIPNRPPSCKE